MPQKGKGGNGMESFSVVSTATINYHRLVANVAKTNVS